MYYLFTNGEGPMSKWGHAVLLQDREAASKKGQHGYTYDGTGGVNIECLKDDIMTKWADAPALQDLTPEEAYRAFAPDDMRTNPGGYVDLVLLAWLWDHVLTPRDIVAVLIRGGAVVFDDSLLSFSGEI